MLQAQIKERAGKGAARRTRREGRTPAVIYGDNKDAVMVSLDPRDVWKQLHRKDFYTSVLDIEADGKKHHVLPRAVQFHPVTDVPWHLDFMRVTDKTMVTVQVPVEFINEEKSPGLKRGGVLNVVRHDVEVTCSATAIPATFEFDLTGLEIHDSLHISQIALPKGVELTITDRDFTIATVAVPSALRSEVADAAAEGEEESTTEGE